MRYLRISDYGPSYLDSLEVISTLAASRAAWLFHASRVRQTVANYPYCHIRRYCNSTSRDVLDGKVEVEAEARRLYEGMYSRGPGGRLDVLPQWEKGKSTTVDTDYTEKTC
jgi:hypothetical protein